MAEFATYVFALAFVAVLLTLTMFALRWWISRGGSRSLFKDRQVPRLAVVDQVMIDTRRKLILIRRDDVEHLIMTGGPADIVVESGIAPRQPTITTADSALPQHEQSRGALTLSRFTRQK